MSVSVTSGGTSYYTTFFPQSVIESTRTETRPGRVAYMGKYILKMHQGYDGMDAAQKHYVDLMFPGARERAESGGVSGFLGNFATHYRGELASSVSAEDGEPAFMGNAREDLAETEWASMVQ